MENMNVGKPDEQSQAKEMMSNKRRLKIIDIFTPVVTTEKVEIDIQFVNKSRIQYYWRSICKRFTIFGWWVIPKGHLSDLATICEENKNSILLKMNLQEVYNLWLINTRGIHEFMLYHVGGRIIATQIVKVSEKFVI